MLLSRLLICGPSDCCFFSPFCVSPATAGSYMDECCVPQRTLPSCRPLSRVRLPQRRSVSHRRIVRIVLFFTRSRLHNAYDSILKCDHPDRRWPKNRSPPQTSLPAGPAKGSFLFPILFFTQKDVRSLPPSPAGTWQSIRIRSPNCAPQK